VPCSCNRTEHSGFHSDTDGVASLLLSRIPKGGFAFSESATDSAFKNISSIPHTQELLLDMEAEIRRTGLTMLHSPPGGESIATESECPKCMSTRLSDVTTPESYSDLTANQSIAANKHLFYSIIFVHGLFGHPLQTWTSKKIPVAVRGPTPDKSWI